MDSFDMTAEQKMLIETVQRFAEKAMRPVLRIVAETYTVPAQTVQAGWNLGLLPGSIDPLYGGFGEYSALTSVLYVEELGWGDVGISLHLLTPNLFALPVALWGTVQQKATYLAPFCGEHFAPATAALIEPADPFDPADLATTAEQQGDLYLLNGKKSHVPLANVATHFLVYAQENGTTQAFIVPATTPGITVGEQTGLRGVNPFAVYSVEFARVCIPTENRLGGSLGIRLSHLLTISRMTLAALAVGQARAAYEDALAYAQLCTGIDAPITHQQPSALRLAAMQLEIETTRRLIWEAAYGYDTQQDATQTARVAKQHADKMLLAVTDCAIQILRGHGDGRADLVERWLHNRRDFVAWEGLLLA